MSHDPAEKGSPFCTAESSREAELQRRVLCLGKLLYSSTLSMHLRIVSPILRWSSHILCFLFPSQICFLSEEAHFSGRKPRCSCLGSFCQRQSGRACASPAPVPAQLLSQHFPAQHPRTIPRPLPAAGCAWLIAQEPWQPSRSSSPTACFLHVCVCRYLLRPENCSSPLHLGLLPALVLCGISLAFTETRQSLDNCWVKELGSYFPSQWKGNLLPYSIVASLKITVITVLNSLFAVSQEKKKPLLTVPSGLEKMILHKQLQAPDLELCPTKSELVQMLHTPAAYIFSPHLSSEKRSNLSYSDLSN